MSLEQQTLLEFATPMEFAFPGIILRLRFAVSELAIGEEADTFPEGYVGSGIPMRFCRNAQMKMARFVPSAPK
jgi:hypothetical protein